MNTIFTTICLLIIIGLFIFFSCQPKSQSKSKTNNIGDFTIQGNKVYYKDTEISGMEANTFKLIDEYYARDANVILWYDTYRSSSDYFISKKIRTKIMQVASVDAFQSLGYGYAKDDTNLFLNGDKVYIKDLVSFRMLNDFVYADQYHVYLYDKIVDGIDGASFQLGDLHYASDATQHFLIRTDEFGKKHFSKIDCDYSSFEILEYPYAKDKVNVYYEGKKVKGLNSARFRLLGHGYLTDGEFIFYRNKPLSGADAASFHVFQENENFLGEQVVARDKNKIYIQDKPHADADVESFKILNENYNRDRKNVYFIDKRIKGADPESFEVLPHAIGETDARDSKYNYFEGKNMGVRQD
ncbi:MAG: DKNYY domain-containing protein [Saprospiraceae bacterium]|nr:DKNYY domain-containing protein [Saprospiraceae bacterium]